ncbi:MAG: class I SAM-dependent methyltransferase [Armatimonadetes bacterium]|nr:class I SAM-dependent methyltransferase [Armatimonadota bacterium]
MERIIQKYKKEFERFEKQKKSSESFWNIREQTAKFLYSFIKAKSPENILEIGTSNGYSTFWLSLAAEKSIVDTIEADEYRFELAKENLKSRKNIIQHFGFAEDIIPKLNKKFDFVFVDAEKVKYKSYLKLLLDKLSDNAVIIADNIVSHKESVIEYLDFLKQNSCFESFLVEIDSGLEISFYSICHSRESGNPKRQ